MTILKDTGSAGFSFPPSFSSVTSYNADSLLLPWNSVGISPYLFPLDALKCPGDGSGREASFFLIEYSCLTMLHSFLLYNEMNQLYVCMGFSHSSVGKESTCNAGDAGHLGSIPGSGRSPGRGNGNPLQHLCQENRMDRGAWWATARGIAESDTTE